MYGKLAVKMNVFRMNTAVSTVDFCDTFLSYKHLISSFSNTKIVLKATSDENLVPPFRFAFHSSGNDLEMDKFWSADLAFGRDGLR